MFTSSRTPQQISRRTLLLAGIGSASLLSACADDGPAPTAKETSMPAKVADYGVDPAQLAMTVYKDASCGCCSGWVDHAEDNGFWIAPGLVEGGLCRLGGCRVGGRVSVVGGFELGGRDVSAVAVKS